MEKRGISPVIAVVLLLTLTVTAVVIITSFVVPFAKNELKEGKECFDALESVEIVGTKFVCHQSNGLTVGELFRTGFTIKINKDNVKGIKVSFTDGNGNSEVYDIFETPLPMGISILGGLGSPPQYLPDIGGQKTYFIEKNKPYKKVEISPILKDGRTCTTSEEVNINICLGVNLW
jgi:flagellin-like protein